MGRRKGDSGLVGVVAVDKPKGFTSHDVVAKARKALGTRRVGHCGTLDPMATGVLVLTVGEATKLVPYLTADDKHYRTNIVFGVGTDSLDADGEVVERIETQVMTREALQEIADSFLGAHQQVAPRVSAIKIDGKRAHAMARAGEDFTPPTRDVVLHSVTVHEVSAHEGGFRASLELHCAKGFYVRAFARDLAQRISSCAHLDMLRRTASGAFTEELCADIQTLAPAQLMSALEAVRLTMPSVVLDETQANDAKNGRLVQGLAWPEGQDHVALEYEDALVAIAGPHEHGARIARGFGPR